MSEPVAKGEGNRGYHWLVTNPACTDGRPYWCCIDGDGTGLWCDSCLAYAATDQEGRDMKIGNHAYPHAPARTDDTARIVANLRSYANGIKAYAPPSSTVVRHMLWDAAVEIERLAEEVVRLRAEVEALWAHVCRDCWERFDR